ncbi:hypothetical protein [Streptomyces sp. HUAS TT20]|uniref:hypothetical protein n=1 Tax=Streptomyces sp. HUAS TT20 TaxID=3447509 RepID=UPI0021D97D04|nr:hypothetical protein [Streptomyces sp. HUAS 15-9]UXY25135.1 hypothetical protein N8I87_00075 [Streptomyces sp. HUAS 15-9]
MTSLQPENRTTIDDLLAKALTRNRYTSYDIAAAEARLRSRQAPTTGHRASAPQTPSPTHTEWTPPEDERTPDADWPGGTSTPSACWSCTGLTRMGSTPTSSPASTTPRSAASPSPSPPWSTNCATSPP